MGHGSYCEKVDCCAGDIISQNGNVQWTARSPNLSACDYFLWAYLMSKMYNKCPMTIAELKKNIREEIVALWEEMTHRVMGICVPEYNIVQRRMEVIFVM
jgi:hypothetical protein